jgi:hypothetical protein
VAARTYRWYVGRRVAPPAVNGFLKITTLKLIAVMRASDQSQTRPAALHFAKPVGRLLMLVLLAANTGRQARQSVSDGTAGLTRPPGAKPLAQTLTVLARTGVQ